MERRVSFKVAKAIKEAGYLQPETDVLGYVNNPNNCYFTGRHSYWDEYRERRIEWDEENELHTIQDWADENEPSYYGTAIAAPTYLDVWLWLWREKKIAIEVNHSFKEGWFSSLLRDERFPTQEDVIIATIEYLVENNLIK